METGTASCFNLLAADRLRRLPACPTSALKTRVRGFLPERIGSGQLATLDAHTIIATSDQDLLAKMNLTWNRGASALEPQSDEQSMAGDSRHYGPEDIITLKRYAERCLRLEFGLSKGQS